MPRSLYLAVRTAFGRARFDPPIYGVLAEPADDYGSVDRELAARFDEPVVLDLRRWPPDKIRGSLRSPGGPAVYDLTQAFDLLAYLPGLTSARDLLVQPSERQG